MKAYDILGIERTSSLDEIKRAYQTRCVLLEQTVAENDTEKYALEEKKTQLNNAYNTCIEDINNPSNNLVDIGTNYDFFNHNRMNSCICIPPGLGWCCARISDSFFSTCCCNDNADSYNTCGEYAAPGLEPTVNYFRVLDVIGWICCILFAIPFFKGICEDIPYKRDQKKRAKQAHIKAAEEEKRRKLEEEERRKREEERRRILQEKAEVEAVLAKTYVFYKLMMRRKANVLYTMRFLNEISPNNELQSVIVAYEQRMNEDALSIKRIINELRKKPGFKEGCISFVSSYSDMFDFVDKL